MLPFLMPLIFAATILLTLTIAHFAGRNTPKVPAPTTNDRS